MLKAAKEYASKEKIKDVIVAYTTGETGAKAAKRALIPVDGDVIAIGGTGEGADTALRIHPSHSAKFFARRIREAIARPSDF